MNALPIRLLLLVVVSFASSACTRIAVDQPVGVKVSTEDLQVLSGEWIGPSEQTWILEVRDSPLPLVVTHHDDGATKFYHCCVTKTEHEVFVVWVRDDELNAFIPFRASGGDGLGVLLYPDIETVKRLVECDDVSGRFDEKKKAWLLSSVSLESVLETKDFWLLDWAMPFIKKMKKGGEPGATDNPDGAQ